jgi:glycosyltransferase involved in cell wall biosynthesis
MKVFNVHNRHAGPGGMEVLFESISRLLQSNGDDVTVIERDNKSIRGLTGKLASFGSMIHSPSSKREMAALLQAKRPDVVHVHNLYPQLSPSVIDACVEARVPVVMSVQDFKLTCPTAQHLRKGRICTKCLGGREYWCAVHNCRGNVPMSIAYAVRNMTARWSRKIHDGVSAFLCCSQFVATQHIRGGLPADRVRVLYNFADLPDAPPRASSGSYVAYIGRISPEKGIDVLIEAARKTGVPVKIAGDPTAMPELQKNLPANVEFVGPLKRDQVPDFLCAARMLCVPSVWYEAFGIVCAEAMAYRLPVIASRLGGLPEVVEHEKTGLCVEAANPIVLADAIMRLWDDPATAQAFGEAGREKAFREYSPAVYYQRLIRHYRSVLTVK